MIPGTVLSYLVERPLRK